MSWVAEPCMSSAGGGAFAQVYSARKRERYLYDFFCQTPRHKRPLDEADFYPITVDFGDVTENFQVGKGSTGVPGAVAGVIALHRDFGSMPLREIVRPAVDAASRGVEVVTFQQTDFRLLEPILATEAKGRELFFRNERLTEVGEVMTMPAMADFLDYMAREGKDAFYRGEVAQKIVKDYAEHGGFLTSDDFANYEVIVRRPLTFRYRDYHISTNPAPAYGGLLIRKIMQLLTAETPTADLFSFSHLQKLKNALAAAEIYSQNPEHLFDSDRNIISPVRRGNTTHFSIIDGAGNAVSLTASNGEGCGYFVENTDIQLNNMLGEAALLPAGFHSWQPDTRLPSMMSPTLAFNALQELQVVTGSSGAGRIAPAVAQSLHYILDGKMPVAEAVNAPRMHVAAGTVNLEPGWCALPSADCFPETVKPWQKKSLFYGGVNAVTSFNGDLQAGADARRDGCALTVS